MEARKNWIKPNWMFDEVWSSLLSKWNSPDFRAKCIQAQKNRASDSGGSLHTGDSITTHEHAICMVRIQNIYVVLNFECNWFWIILYDYILFYYTIYDIALHNHNIIYIVHRQKCWVVLHILMRYLRRLINRRVMVNSLMKD